MELHALTCFVFLLLTGGFISSILLTSSLLLLLLKRTDRLPPKAIPLFADAALLLPAIPLFFLER